MVILLLMATAGLSTDCHVSLKGEIDDAMVKKVEELNCLKPKIVLTSFGGDSTITLRLLSAIESKRAEVHLKEYCISACADIILPLVRRLTVEHGTFIAHHGNPFMKQAIAWHYRIPGIQYCHFEDVVQLRREYKDRGRNVLFWKWQLSHLKLIKFTVQSDPAPQTCPTMRMTFSYDLIATTRAELKDELGIDIGVQSCADIPGCVEAQRRGPFRGTRILTLS